MVGFTPFPISASASSLLTHPFPHPPNLSLSAARVSIAYSLSGTVKGVPVVPPTARPRHLQLWHMNAPVALVLLCPPHQRQTYTHRGRKNTNQTSPHPPSHPHMASLLHPPTSTLHGSLQSTGPVLFPLTTAYTTPLSPRFHLNLTFLIPISFRPHSLLLPLSHPPRHVPW